MTGEELEAAMKELELSQGDLAKRMDVRPETVHRWLRGVGGKPRKVPGPVAVAVNLWLQAKADRPPITEDAI